MLYKLILSLNLLIIMCSNYAMDQEERIQFTLEEMIINEVVPKLCSGDELLSCNKDFEERLVNFYHENFFLNNVLSNKNNKDRLFLLTAFEADLEYMSWIQSLMFVNKNLCKCIKMYQDKGIIDGHYKKLALKLEQYDMSGDIYNIVRYGFIAKYNLESSLEQLILINDHSKTLNFFSCKQFYEDSKDYTYQLGCLINWLIMVRKRRSFDFFNETIYFHPPAQHELVLTKIIKKFTGTFNSSTILSCECPNYMANLKLLLYPEILIIKNGKSSWQYSYTLIKNEDYNPELSKV